MSQNITKESFEQFKQRAVNTMYSILIETINNLIESMNAGLNDVIRNKRNRARYSLVLYVVIVTLPAMYMHLR